jgi:hypothetical protein
MSASKFLTDFFEKGRIVDPAFFVVCPQEKPHFVMMIHTMPVAANIQGFA